MDDLALLLRILEVRAYAPAMGGRDGAAEMAALANLPAGWLFEEPRGDGDQLILRASGPNGDEIEVAGQDAEQAWLSMAHELAARGSGRMLPVEPGR